MLSKQNCENCESRKKKIHDVLQITLKNQPFKLEFKKELKQVYKIKKMDYSVHVIFCN